MVSVEFFIDIFLPAILLPWGLLRNICWGLRRPSYNDYLEISESQPPGTPSGIALPVTYVDVAP